MTINTSCSCNFYDDKFEVTSTGGCYFGDFNPVTNKVTLNLGRTIKAHLGNLFIWAVLVVGFMSSLALTGFIVSHLFALFGVDTSIWNNWFWNIFCFGRFPNVFLPSLFAAFQYTTDTVHAYMLYKQQKAHIEYRHAENVRQAKMLSNTHNK